jgi:succinate dehydrogenase / fumarate reductase flavoprotein subunit
VLVVGSGLAGASAAATLAELGYKVECFCFQDSPRRAHSIAAQGGINAAKNYRNDGDSVHRLFYDTVKGGDFRAREANVYRLAQLSVNIIDQCVAQGVPFAREYGGLLDNRSFGGAQVSRTFYARGQTGQQLLLGAYQALSRQIGLGTSRCSPRTEMLDVVVVDGHARGIVVRDLVTGEDRAHAGDAVVLATGGYGNVFYLSTNAKGCNVTATWRAQARRRLRQPVLHADPPDLHPGQRRLPVEADADVGVAAQRRPRLGAEEEGRQAQGRQIPEASATTTSSASTRASATSCPATSRRARRSRSATTGAASAPAGAASTSTSATRSSASARTRSRRSYGNLFHMYAKITAEDPYSQPMRIYPAVHYTMGGLWVDYNLQSTIPGLFVLGEANFSDHGANRLGASALMQGSPTATS